MSMSSSSRSRLPGAIVAVGSVSLLNEVSSEMIDPLLPLFLERLGASVAFILKSARAARDSALSNRWGGIQALLAGWVSFTSLVGRKKSRV